MDKLDQARQSLQEFAAKFAPAVFLEATVISVDEGEFLADLKTDEGLELFDCRLRALASGNKSIEVLPIVGSKVLVAKLEEDDFFVLACDEIQSFQVTVGDSALKVTETEIVLNDGALGGLVKVKELEKELNKTNAVVTAFVQAFSTWVPVPSDGGAALKTAIQSALTGKSVGSFNNIENKKIKHG